MPWRRALAKRIEPRMAPPPAPEHRDAGVSLGVGIGAFGTSGGGSASIAYAENVAAVSACVSIISGTIASLPARVYRTVEGGRIEVTNHPVTRLIRNPCEHLDWVTFAETLLSQCLLHGNGIAAIEFDGAGRPIALRPIPWPFVQVMLTPSGRMVYDVAQFVAPWGGNGLARRYLDSEILHIKARSNDGYLGISPLARAPEVLQGALQVQTFSNASFANGVFPSGTLLHPGHLGSDARSFLSREIQDNTAGVTNARKLLVLDEGMVFSPISTKPIDAELLESRRYSVIEIARLYNVPPSVIQAFENNSFTSAETAGKWFATFCLTLWVRKLEAAFAKSLFVDGSDCHLDLDLSGLTRGDYAARWASYATAAQNKILTPDEIREVEGWPPLPDQPGELVPGAGANP